MDFPSQSSALSLGLQPSFQVRYIVVGEEFAGQRLDNFLFRELKGVPKNRIYRLIRDGQIRINKGRAKSDSRLIEGDKIRIPPLRMAHQASRPQSGGEAAIMAFSTPGRSFPILYEDDYLLAIDKPEGVAVHGGSGVSFGVIEILRRTRPDIAYLELVHRLDRDTSGVLLLAKKSTSLKALQKQFKERVTHKLYLALVAGKWPARKKVLDMALRKYLTPQGERRVHVVPPEHPDAMRAISVVELLSFQNQGFSLLSINLKTGRTHQIRVHLASSGYPIVGDDKYGDFGVHRENHNHLAKRMFLHAHRLQFNHPSTGQPIVLRAPVPESFQTAVPDFNFGLLGDSGRS